MKVLVTGATGFIGSELVRHLLAAGDEVVILRRPASRLNQLGSSASLVVHRLGDVRDPIDVLDAMEGIDAVYHTAAYVGFAGKRDAVRLHDVNVGGTAHVVNAAVRQGVRRVVFTSSIAALGRASGPGTLIDESNPWHASPYDTLYARSKHLGELEVHRGIAEGLDGVIVNPALVFGPGRLDENTGALVEAIRRGRLPVFPRSGVRCVVDVSDVAEGHRLAMARGRTGERYFLGSENLSWQDIFSILARAFGVKPPRWPLHPRGVFLLGTLAEFAGIALDRPAGLTRETARSVGQAYHYSNRKAVQELGITFRSFEATARRMAEAWPRSG